MPRSAARRGVGDDAPTTVRLDPAAASAHLGVDVSGLCGPDPVRGVERVAVVTAVASLADPPVDAHDGYLRLHLLSHRLIRPRQANLDGLFGVLNNVVWTSEGPCSPEGFEQTRLGLVAAGRTVQVFGLDKFPRMTDYVVPTGVRIADADRVRMGAHLADGTTVMHEGYVNFNAGTLGTAMVEGRISQGVIVDDGSDVGGGASIMGTLSGGGKEIIRVGKRCLIGANGGIGISLGDDCVVEAGLYVTAGTRVTLPDGTVTKAGELSGVERPAVPPQQHQRGGRGAATRRRHRRAEHRTAQQRLSPRSGVAGRRVLRRFGPSGGSPGRRGRLAAAATHGGRWRARAAAAIRRRRRRARAGGEAGHPAAGPGAPGPGGRAPGGACHQGPPHWPRRSPPGHGRRGRHRRSAAAAAHDPDDDGDGDAADHRRRPSAPGHRRPTRRSRGRCPGRRRWRRRTARRTAWTRRRCTCPASSASNV